MSKFLKPVVLLFSVALVASACSTSSREEAAEDRPSVSFASPADGDTVSSPVQISMQAENYTIEPAGEAVAGAGHFHVLIDAACVERGTVIPSDDAHVHFGGGQLETELELEPGDYTLCLQVGDGLHNATNLTEVINITVE